jgi:hypothetical protein
MYAALGLNSFHASYGQPPFAGSAMLPGLAYFHANDMAQASRSRHREFSLISSER